MESVLRNEQVKSAIGTVKDKYTAAKINISSPDGRKELDIAIRKATSHDDVVPKEKHVRTLKQACGTGFRSGGIGNASDSSYVISRIQKRMHNEHGWLVTAKALMTFHRLLRECDTSFQDELLNFMDKAGCRRVLRMDNYKDKMHNNTWDVSSWIRVYSSYLDERLNFYRVLKHDVDAPPEATSVRGKFSEKSMHELIEAMECLERMVDAIFSCIPDGEALQHDVSLASVALVAREASNAYCAFHDGMLNLAERIYDISSPSEATAALNIIRRASELYNGFMSYKKKIEAHPDLSRGARLADVAEPPAKEIKVAEDHLSDIIKACKSSSRSAAVGNIANNAKARLTSAKFNSFTNVQVLTPGVSKAPAQEVDLLTDLDLGMPPQTSEQGTSHPEPVTVTIQASDPFGNVKHDPFGATKPHDATAHQATSAPWPQSPDPFAPAPAMMSMPTLSPSPLPAIQSPTMTTIEAGISLPAPRGTVMPLTAMVEDPFEVSSPAMSSSSLPVSSPVAQQHPMIDGFSNSALSLSMSPLSQKHSAAFSSPAHAQHQYSSATNNPFGGPMSPTPFDTSSSYYTPQKPISNPFSPSSMASPGALNGEALTAAGLSPTMLATAMAKNSVTDPFADLTGISKPASPLASSGMAMNATKAL